MRLSIEDIKKRSNADLIAVLCYMMYSQDKDDLKLQEYICKELELREVIDSANELIERLK